MRKILKPSTAAMTLILITMAFIGLVGLPKATYAVQNQGRSALNVLPVRGNIYMISGAGGNITASIGRDGILLVDAGSDKMADQVVATVNQVATAVMNAPVAATTCVGPSCQGVLNFYGWTSPAFNSSTVARMPVKPLRYILDTSMDPDHAGGNAKVGTAGKTFTGGNITGTITDSATGAIIVAQDNVLVRMSEEGEGKLSAAGDAVPRETYISESHKLTSFFNGEGVQMFHTPNAHTDGDSIVWFRYSDVISAGDIYSTVSYPVIDLKHGGSINGVLDGLNKILDISYAEYRSQGGTMIIPGHGRLSDVGDVANYRNMVAIIRDRILDLVNKGMTLEQVKAAKPTLDYDGRWGSNTGPWTTSMFIDATYQSLKKK